MKICYVSYEYPPQFGGGIGTYVGNMSKLLSKYGEEVHVITYNGGDQPDNELVDGVHIHRIKMNGAQMELIHNAASSELSTLLYWSLYSEKVHRKVEKLQSAYQLDVYEFCDYRGEGYHTLLAKKLNKQFQDTKIIVRLHTALFVLNEYNDIKSHSPGMSQLVNFENLPMMLADHVVSPTQILAGLTERYLDLVTPVSVVPHPIDIDHIPYEPNRSTKSAYLYVGRLEKRKGVEDLIRAALEVIKWDSSIRLKLIGGDTDTGPGGTSMKSYLINLIPDEWKNNFQFVDRTPREEVIKAYGQARASIFPSLFENFPNVCLEAMATGCPVIVSDNSGMAEMIADKEMGYIHRAADVQDLVDKWKKFHLIGDEERLLMGTKARKRVETAYSPEVIYKQQKDYFLGITNSVDSRKSTTYTPGLVSIVIPCFNHGEWLKQTLKSITASTYSAIEVIIVNDGSTQPETLSELALVEAEGFKVIHQVNGGLSSARNTGIKAARGEFILPLDADDLIAPSYIEKAVTILNEDKGVGFVYCHVEFIGSASGVWKTPEFDPNLLLVSNICVATSMFRHSAFDEVGGYRTDMIYGFEDWDFWIYLVENGWRGKCIPEPLFYYRKHDSSMLSSSQKNRPYLIAKMIEHHRDTYIKSLNYVLVEKDRMFFQEHMSNYYNHTQLQQVMHSKAWKFVQFVRKVKDKIKRTVGQR